MVTLEDEGTCVRHEEDGYLQSLLRMAEAAAADFCGQLFPSLSRAAGGPLFAATTATGRATHRRLRRYEPRSRRVAVPKPERWWEVKWPIILTPELRHRLLFGGT